MKKIVLLFALGATLVTSSAFVISSGGEIGSTGSPGENTCTNCHGGGGGITSISITANPAFTNNQYIPGQVYSVTLTVANASFSKFGFDCEILTNSNTNAGTMAAAQSGVQFANAGSRKNATHTTPKTGTGSADFSFQWTAPASGNATFYVAGNAVNGNGSTSGDRPGNTSMVLTDITTNVHEQVASAVNFNVYPNPSANEINIQYSLANTAAVKALLYNLDGKEVSHVYDGHQDAGINTIHAALSDELPNGFYILKLSVNNKVCGQRMLIKK